jgi:NAD(P)H-hydrate epimerase
MNDNFDELNLADISYITREESLAIEKAEFSTGVTPYALMLNAGKSICKYIQKKYKHKQILVLAGGGNNGGDGSVASSCLSNTHEVEIIYMKSPNTEEAIKAYDELKSTDVSYSILDIDISMDEIKSKINKAELIVDSIFGVGIQSEIRSPVDEIIKLFSELRDDQVLVSVDIPSGIDCNTGEWYCESFIPDDIVTMQFTKKCFQSLSEDTKINVADIGIKPRSVYVTSEFLLKQYWPRRDLDSHKGQNGQIMVIGGSDEFTGAPVLSGMATMRSGVDTLRIVVPETIRDIVAGYAEDFIVVKVQGERITSKPFRKYRDMAVARHDVICIGMGMSNHPDCNKFTREFFEFAKENVKFVLDAEAVRAFRGKTDSLKNNSGVVITPHRAELRMMLKEKIPDKMEDLIPFLEEKARDLEVTILMKGRIDIITNGHRTLLNETGHPGMTVGGSGDVLAGVVAAAVNFIDDPFIAASIGAYLMGRAGEFAAEKYGNSLIASDIIKEIPKVLKYYDVNR